MEKRWYLISGIFLFILVIGTSIFVYEYNKYQTNKILLEEGILLVKNDELETAVNKCNQMDYLNYICYSSVLGGKLYRIKKFNKTISEELSEEFCYSILEENQFPWWFIFTDVKTKGEEGIKEIKEHCFKTLNPEHVPSINNPLVISFEYDNDYRLKNKIEVKQNKPSILQGGFLNTRNQTINIKIGIDNCFNLKLQNEINAPIEVISLEIEDINEGQTVGFKTSIKASSETGEYRCNLITYNEKEGSFDIYASKEFLLSVK